MKFHLRAEISQQILRRSQLPCVHRNLAADFAWLSPTRRLSVGARCAASPAGPWDTALLRALLRLQKSLLLYMLIPRASTWFRPRPPSANLAAAPAPDILASVLALREWKAPFRDPPRPRSPSSGSPRSNSMGLAPRRCLYTRVFLPRCKTAPHHPSAASTAHRRPAILTPNRSVQA